MANVIIYASGFSKHTKNIAEVIGKKVIADVYNVKDAYAIDFTKYDTVFFGSNVHAGHPARNLQRFFAENRSKLAGKRFIVFLSCMFDGERGQKQADDIARMFDTKEVAFFPTKGEKDLQGIPVKVDEFVEYYRKSIE